MMHGPGAEISLRIVAVDNHSAVSLQLRSLSLAGLVDVRTESRNRFYRARREAIGPLADHLERMWGDALWRLKNAAELEHSRRGPRPRRKRSGTRRN